jgi:predicted nucleotidyltransferase
MKTNEIIRTIVDAYPATQAIYLFGSYGTEYENQTSDVDIALLLPHDMAKQVGSLALSKLRVDLEGLVRRDVDLINLRLVSTVFQKEIIAAERRVYCADEAAAAEFEMLVLSFYQKLNEERREILEAFFESGRAYDV